MVCLSCGCANAYGSSSCQGCGREFPADPPFVHSNHVCQLQVAIQDRLGGELSREDLAECYTRFLDLISEFDQHWQLVEGGSLAERARDLPSSSRQAVVSLDRSLAFLQDGMSALDDYLDSDKAELLPVAVESLEDFFRSACQACAALLHKEAHQSLDDTPGTVLDVRSE